MERPGGSITIRIVCLIMCALGSTESGQLMRSHPSSIINSGLMISVNRPTRSISSEGWTSQHPLCRYSTNECDFQLGNLTCRQVLNFQRDYLTNCSHFIVNLDIVQGRFKSINESGLLQVKYPALQRLAIRNSDLEQMESVPDSDQLAEIELINNSKLESIRLPILDKLRILNLTNNKLQYIQDLSIGFNLSSLDLAG